MRNKARFFLAVFLGLALPLKAQAPAVIASDYLTVTNDLSVFIPSQMKKWKVKGVSVALVDGSRIVWAKGFGTADEKTQIPADEKTRYRIGAMSQIFTASEILRLAQAGRVKLDAPLSKSLTDFSIQNRFEKAPPLTLRSLLAHHSGLPAFYLKGMWVEPQSLEALTKELGQNFLAAPPQTIYRLSYLDGDLLGRVIEVKTGKAFEQAMADDILGPLRMNDSSYGNSSLLSKGYWNDIPSEPVTMRDVPFAGMISTARDLAVFLQKILGEKPNAFQTQTQKAAWKAAYPGLPLDFGHEVGLGWTLNGMEVEKGGSLAWQNGNYPPYVSQITVLRDKRLGVVFLSNSEGGERMAMETSRRALKGMVNEKEGLTLPLEEAKLPVPPAIQVAPEVMDSYTGLYSAFGQVTPIENRGDHLEGRFFNYDFDLIPIAPGRFMPRFVFLFLFPINFPQFPLEISHVNGQTLAVLRGLPFPIPLQKITAAPIPESWKKREGRYLQEKPDGQIDFKELKLKEEKGVLTISAKIAIKPFHYPLSDFKIGLLPVSGDDAIVPGLFFTDGDTLHAVDENHQIRIFYSGYWFRRDNSGPMVPD